MTRFWPSVRLHLPTLMNCLAGAAAEIARQLLHRKGDTVLECDAPDVDKSHAADVIFGPDTPVQVTVASLSLLLHTYSQDLANAAPDKGRTTSLACLTSYLTATVLIYAPVHPGTVE